MLSSQKCLEALGRVFSHICYLKVIPFDWDSRTMSISVIEDSRRYISFAIYANIWFNTGYLLLSQAFLQMSIQERSVVSLWTVAYLMVATSAYNILSRRYELVNFINRFFCLNADLKGKVTIL